MGSAGVGVLVDEVALSNTLATPRNSQVDKGVPVVRETLAE